MEFVNDTHDCMRGKHDTTIPFVMTVSSPVTMETASGWRRGVTRYSVAMMNPTK